MKAMGRVGVSKRGRAKELAVGLRREMEQMEQV